MAAGKAKNVQQLPHELQSQEGACGAAHYRQGMLQPGLLWELCAWETLASEAFMCIWSSVSSSEAQSWCFAAIVWIRAAQAVGSWFVLGLGCGL